jgi:hypothetical protein
MLVFSLILTFQMAASGQERTSPLSSANSILLLEGPDLSDLVVLVEEEDFHRVPFIVAIR